MYMEKYMTFEAVWEKQIGIDEDTRMPSFAPAETIKCFEYGKNVFLREDNSSTMVSAKAYLTLENVELGDKIDGQVVKSVNNYPENWDANKQLFEVLTWNT